MYDQGSQMKAVVISDRASTEIENYLSRADNALERLSDRLDSMEARLRPVMMATGSGTEGSKHGIPQEALSPLGNTIRTIEGRVDAATDRLESLLNGLAL